MRFIFHIAVILIAFPLSVSSQAKFQRTFGSIFIEKGLCIHQTLDKGYIIAGYCSGYGNGSSDGYLVKIDSMGNFQWERTVGGLSIDWLKSVVQTSDSGYAAVGYSNSYGISGDYDVFFVRTDKNGNILYTKTFGGKEWDFGNSIANTNSGGFMICGSTYSYGKGNDDVYVLELNSTGDTLWTKTYGGAMNDVGNEIVKSYGNGYLISGKTNSIGIGDYDAYLLRIDAIGDTLWTRTFGDTAYDVANSAHSNKDSTIFVAGTTYQDSIKKKQGLFFKLDKDGNVIWKGIPQKVNMEFFSVNQMDDGNMVLAGETDAVPGYMMDVQIYQFHTLGWFLCGPTSGSTENEGMYYIEPTADKGMITVGYTRSYGKGMDDIYVMKLDSFCNKDLTVKVVPTALNSHFSNNPASVSIYPHPINGTASIELNGIPQSSARISMRIYDIAGRELTDLMQYTSEQQESKTLIKVDTERLSRGNYLFQFFSGEEYIASTPVCIMN